MPILKPSIDGTMARQILGDLMGHTKKPSGDKQRAKEIFNEVGLTVEAAAQALQTQLYCDDNAVKQRAIDTVLKVQGALEPDKDDSKNIQINFTFENNHSESALAVLVPR